MSNLATELGHLKNDIVYPADRQAILAACNNMSDYPKEDRDWFVNALPEGEYENAEGVLKAVLTRV